MMLNTLSFTEMHYYNTGGVVALSVLLSGIIPGPL